MDGRGLLALVFALVVVGSGVGIGPSVVAAGEPGPDHADVDATAVSGGSTGDAAASVQDEEAADDETIDDSGTDENETIAGNETDGNETVAGNETDEDGANGPSLDGYDELRIGVDLQENGSASWELEYQYRIGGDDGTNETDWDRVGADLEDRPEAYLELIHHRWSETAAETGDADSIGEVTFEIEETEAPEEHAYVRFSFQWQEFGHVELNRIEAGDAIEGLELGDRMRLVVSWPEGYSAESIEPEPDDRRDETAIWDGEETEFLDGEPSIELLEETNRDVGDDDPGVAGPGVPWLALLGVAILVTVGAAGWRHLRDGTDPDATSAADSESDGPSQQGPPMELLSNEERVLRLLEDRGGRLKQQEVVAELDWTEAKTSQVVSTLRDDDAIEVFRIGRENVLVLNEEGETGSDGA